MEDNNYIGSDNTFHPVDSIMKSLFTEELVSAGIDIAEISIDDLIELEELKNIPIVNTVYGLAKTSLAIRDRFLLKKLLVFIKDLDQGKAKTEEIEKRRKAAKNNEKWLKKEVELITIHLDRLDELEKVRITSSFYIEYINQRISFSQYREYLAIIERVFFQDFMQLLDVYDALVQEKKVKEYLDNDYDGGIITKQISELNCDRLIAVGLIQAKRTPMFNGKISSDYYLTELGLKFAEVLVKINEDTNY